MGEPIPTSFQVLRDVIPEHVAAKIRELGNRYGIRNIRVFGSFARGEASPGSDVDLLVEYVPGNSGFAFVDFCEEVQALLARRVDVVTEKSLPPLIRDKVRRQAIAI